MKLQERITLEVPLNELKNEKLFYDLIGISTDNVPEDLKELIIKTKTLGKGEHPVCVYQSYPIQKKESDYIELQTGDIFKGKILSDDIFDQCYELICFIVTLKNYQPYNDDSIINQFFIDSWRSAMVENAFLFFYKKIEKELLNQKTYLTNSFCPGYNNFPIENQSIMFKLLEPEDIGVQLNESYIMDPIKSISGIIGVSKHVQQKQILTCSHCFIKDTCTYKDRGVCDYARKY